MRKVLLYCLLVFSGSVYSQRGVETVTNVENNNRNIWAIIVGISNYLEVKDLQYADQDATLFAQYLEKDLSVPKNNIKLFINEDATRFNIVDELYHLNEIVKPNDLVYIYFAGHGDLEAKIAKENALLLLYKSLSVSYLKGTDFISVMELKQWLDNLTEKKAQIVFISDACHAGGLIGGAEGQEKTTAALTSEWKNQTKLLSCQANELSFEGKEWGGGRGLFSYHLIEGLQGLADTDEDKGVSLFEIQSYLQTQVRKQAFPNRQTPVAVGNLDQILGRVNTQTLLSLKERKAKNYPILASVNAKGIEDKLLANADSMTRYFYVQYKRNFDLKNYTQPENNCALYFFNKISVTPENEDAIRVMRRNLAAVLQEKAMEIIAPLLEGKETYRKLDWITAVKELRIAKEILGNKHYLNNALEARALFLEAINDCNNIYDVTEKEHRINLNKSEKEIIAKNVTKLLYSEKLEPNAPYIQFALGLIHQLDNNPLDAEKYYLKYIGILPNFAKAYYNMGILYKSLKKSEKVIEYYKKAIVLKPNYYDAIFNLASAYDDLQEYDKALEYYQIAIKIDSTDAEIYNNLASVYYHQNLYEKSIEYSRKSISLNPKLPKAYENLGIAYSGLSEFGKATENFEKALSLSPKDETTSLSYNLACLYSLQKMQKKSLKYFEQALQKGFNNFEHIKIDTDLDNIRQTPQFKALLQKYFPEKN